MMEDPGKATGIANALDPLISVVVPAFDAEEFLGPMLDSMIAEVDGRGEIVVCDDGSTDATAEVFRRHAGHFRGATLFRQHNAGAAAARNAALRRSSGRWVMFFDADDLVAPGTLESMLQVAQEHPGDIVHCGWATFDSDPESLTLGPLLADEPLPGWEWLRRAYLSDYPTYTGSLLLPRALVERIGPWDERLGFQDDAEFFARAICAAPAVRYCATAQFRYRSGVSTSLSKRVGRRRAESHLLAADLSTRHLLAARDSDDTRAAAARQMLLVSHATYLSAPDISARAEARAWELAPRGFRPPLLITGGTRLHALQAVLGWKGALRIRALARRLAARLGTAGSRPQPAQPDVPRS